MSEWDLMTARKDNPLRPVATWQELAWWRGRRWALYRGIVLRWGIPVGLVPIVSVLLTRPERFLTAAAFGIVGGSLLISLGGSLLHLWLTGDRVRDQAIRWKRIREALGDSARRAEDADDASATRV